MRPPESECICPKKVGSLGRLDGINMGQGRLRVSTADGCPVHDSCHGYTKEYRAVVDNGPWLYCPHHKTRNCP